MDRKNLSNVTVTDVAARLGIAKSEANALVQVLHTLGFAKVTGQRKEIYTLEIKDSRTGKVETVTKFKQGKPTNLWDLSGDAAQWGAALFGALNQPSDPAKVAGLSAKGKGAEGSATEEIPTVVQAA